MFFRDSNETFRRPDGAWRPPARRAPAAVRGRGARHGRDPQAAGCAHAGLEPGADRLTETALVRHDSCGRAPGRGHAARHRRRHRLPDDAARRDRRAPGTEPAGDGAGRGELCGTGQGDHPQDAADVPRRAGATARSWPGWRSRMPASRRRGWTWTAGRPAAGTRRWPMPTCPRGARARCPMCPDAMRACCWRRTRNCARAGLRSPLRPPRHSGADRSIRLQADLPHHLAQRVQVRLRLFARLLGRAPPPAPSPHRSGACAAGSPSPPPARRSAAG